MKEFIKLLNKSEDLKEEIAGRSIAVLKRREESPGNTGSRAS